MFNTFMIKFLSALMSFLLSMGTFFGAYVPSSTEEPEKYYDSNIKNVIYLIGDGMGFNHLEKTKKERNITLTMDDFAIRGSSRTRSINKKVTDSAAGGTALAAGIRTSNSAVGVYHLDKKAKFFYPKNITEICREAGMLTGVVTTDETSGATPASFSAHSSNRNNTEDITNDQLASGINLIWGKANGVATASMAEKCGYEYVTNYEDMMSLEEGSYSFAQFTNSLWTLEPSDDKTPNLEQMAIQAVDLLDDTDEGFFLMIEGAHIDKHSHSNDSDEMTESLEEFDRTIEAMLDYAKKDGETLIIVTADHETGAITLKDNTYKYTSDDHSAANVPVLVYGTDKFIAGNETINNYEIPIRIAYTFGFDESKFPFQVNIK